MRIPCPYCGSRDTGEFVYRGDAGPARPEPVLPGDRESMYAYLYPRTNPAGLHLEHWYHAQGCRNWLVVERNTLTHEIASARFAGDAQ